MYIYDGIELKVPIGKSDSGIIGLLVLGEATIERIKPKPQESFWAEENEEYYYITQDGKIDFDTFVNGCLSDVFKRKLGNCFKTNNISQEQRRAFV